MEETLEKRITDAETKFESLLLETQNADLIDAYAELKKLLVGN